MKILCPVCESNKSKKIINLHCGNFDKSTLYEKVRIRQCKSCGHVYNELTEAEIKGLKEYYDNEYALINLSNKRDNLDMYSQEHYQKIYNLLDLNKVKKDARILDVGCNTGGFIRFLKAKGFDDVFGVDWSFEYLKEAKKEFGIFCKFGECERLPYKDSSFDIVIADQVLEHVVSVKKAVEEIKRVLKVQGLVYISIPDVQEYMNTNFFPYYWFIMREHLQHFNLRTLENLMMSNSYVLYDISKDSLPLGECSLRTLNMLFAKTTNEYTMLMPLKHFMYKVNDSLKIYLNDSKNRLKELKKELKLLKNKFVAFIGIGREFLFLYKNIISKWSKLNIYNKKFFIDSIEYKTENLSIEGKYLWSKNVFNLTNYYITAFTHRDTIQKKLNNQ